MIDQNGDIYRAANQCSPATRPVLETSPAPDCAWPMTIEVHGIVIQIWPGDAEILRFAGDASISMRAGQPDASLPIGRTQGALRLDPPANSRATEVGSQAR